jgi:hypothetical protein
MVWDKADSPGQPLGTVHEGVPLLTIELNLTEEFLYPKLSDLQCPRLLWAGVKGGPTAKQVKPER